MFGQGAGGNSSAETGLSALIVRASILGLLAGADIALNLTERDREELQTACKVELDKLIQHGSHLLSNSPLTASIELQLEWILKAAAVLLRHSKTGSVCLC